jgi:serine/threonine-protein kinase
MTDRPPDERVRNNPQAGEGTPFGRYRLIELLGRGGMGEVWRAFDTGTERVVAVKVLPEHMSADDVFQQRFRREARAAASLNSPHVIPIHNHGEIDGRLYVDMRLVEGRDLQTILADGPLELGRAVRIVEQVARALHSAHKVGLVHRDVKPSNILLDEDDYAYLIDFGIARAEGDSGLTGTKTLIGSWHYMAPERFKAGRTDSRVDVYALACVLYECLTGQRVYPGDSLEQQYASHLAIAPPRPSTVNPSVPVEFDRVTDKGLAKAPDQRYATTIELALAARDATTEPIPRQFPPPAPPAPPVNPAPLRVSQQPSAQSRRVSPGEPTAVRQSPDWAASRRQPANTGWPPAQPPPAPPAQPPPAPPALPPPAPPPSVGANVGARSAQSVPIPKASKPDVSREILTLEVLLGSVAFFFLIVYTISSRSDGLDPGGGTNVLDFIWWAAMLVVLFDVVRRVRQRRRKPGR